MTGFFFHYWLLNPNAILNMTIETKDCISQTTYLAVESIILNFYTIVVHLFIEM